jgi:hypothetical protein
MYVSYCSWLFMLVQTFLCSLLTKLPDEYLKIIESVTGQYKRPDGLPHPSPIWPGLARLATVSSDEFSCGLGRTMMLNCC